MMKSAKIEQNWQDVVMHETTKVDKKFKSWKEVFWTSQTRMLDFSLETSLRYEPRTNQTRQTRTSHKLEPVSAFPSTNNQTIHTINNCSTKIEISFPSGPRCS